MERVKASGNQTTQREGVDSVSAPRIVYRADVPVEVREAIAPYLTRWASLVPRWCHDLTVVWNDRDTESGALSVAVYYEYRNADIEILANFLTNPDDRERQVVHELMHLQLAPLVSTSEALRDAVVKQVPEMKSWANEQLRQSEEATTCDLTELVLQVKR